MQKKIVISMAVVTLLLMGIMATTVIASNTSLAKNTAVSQDLQVISKTESPKTVVVAERSRVSVKTSNVLAIITADDSSVSDATPNVESLREAVPATYEETDAKVSTQRVRFLLYTHDGKNVMWGFVGNGYFVGTDNQGKRCWGIYDKGTFAGFYDGEFFWGNYRGGNWKAEGLFGLNSSHGKYILFPTPDITPTPTVDYP